MGSARQKDKSIAATLSAGPDVAGMMVKIQEQLSLLGKKLDTLISRMPPNPGQARPQSFQQPPSVQQPQQFRQPRQFQQHNGFKGRPLCKAVCADCHKDCEVPFRPSGERPVYCKECFSKRKAGNGPFKGNNSPLPAENKAISQPAASQAAPPVKPQAPATKKPSAKKKQPREIKRVGLESRKKRI
jgi:CxxC-x17-CxxC domain-containing protein